MRERVRYGEIGRRDIDAGRERRRGGRPAAWRLRPWSRAAGPRPVRPGVVRVAVRPAEAPRPAGPGGRPVAEAWWDARTGLRLLARRSGAAPARCAARYRVRRAVAAVALVAAAAAAVVVLGLLARLAEPAPATVSAPAAAAVVSPAPVVVTAESGETVWDVADRVAPGLSGPRRAALAERIAVDNDLASVRLRPGQVLRVAVG